MKRTSLYRVITILAALALVGGVVGISLFGQGKDESAATPSSEREKVLQEESGQPPMTGKIDKGKASEEEKQGEPLFGAPLPDDDAWSNQDIQRMLEEQRRMMERMQTDMDKMFEQFRKEFPGKDKPFISPFGDEPFDFDKHFRDPRSDPDREPGRDRMFNFPRQRQFNEDDLLDFFFRGEPFSAGGGTIRPGTDITETDDSVVVKMDIPGMDKGDIEIRLEDNVLTVRGERKEEQELQDKDKNIYKKERRMGSFERKVALPDTIDENDVNASYENGVLTVTIGKKQGEKKRGKTIPITSLGSKPRA